MAEYLDSYDDESEKSIQHDQLGFLCYQPGRLPFCAFPPCYFFHIFPKLGTTEIQIPVQKVIAAYCKTLYEINIISQTLHVYADTTI